MSTPVFTLSLALLEAETEEAVLRAVMRAGQDLLGAQGSAFIPFGEWKTGPIGLTEGLVPRALSGERWEMRLGQPLTRQRCKRCEAHQADRSCQLFSDALSQSSYVFCLPLRAADWDVGVISFFLPYPPASATAVLPQLKQIAALADKALARVRSHSQELELLQHLFQSARQMPSTVEAWQQPLLSRLVQTTGADGAFLWIAASRKYFAFPPQISLPSLERIEAWWEKAQRTTSLSLEDTRPVGERSQWHVFPLRWASDADGLLGLSLRALSRRQRKMLKLVAEEIALLLRQQERAHGLEYQAILEERVRLAREIHDGLAQTLAFLHLEAGRLELALQEGKTSVLSQGLTMLRRVLNDALTEARWAIAQLRRSPQGNWTDWLRQTLDEFAQRSGIPVEANLAPLPSLPPLVYVQLARIVQEALNNVWKHAQARTVRISCVLMEGNLCLEIADDGRGFDPSRVSPRYGLLGMEERATAIGAILQVDSHPGAGTCLRLKLPLGGR